MNQRGDVCGGQLGVALEQYMTHLQQFRQCSHNTVIAYRRDGRGFVEWCEGQRIDEPSALTQSVLLRYLADQPAVSPNTVRRRIHALSGWFRFMIRQGLMDQNPAEGLPLPRRKRALPQYPTAEQVGALTAAARNPLERLVIYLLAGTGVRRAELLSIDVEDLSADLADLTVTGKGDKQRQIALPAAVQQVLREYLQARGTQPGALLLNRVGKRLGLTSLRRLFSRLLRRAGLQDAGFTLHSMRHAYATMLVRAGVDLGTIRDLLGHSDISVTSIYLHSDLRSKRAAVELLPIAQMGGGASG